MSDMPNAPSEKPTSAAAAAAAAALANDDQSSAADTRAASSEPLPEPQIDLTQVIDGLQDEISTLNEKILRTYAEMDNMRKRADREKADTAKYAITKFATDVVTIGDNLARALSSVKPEAAAADPNLKVLVEGMEMTDRALVSMLERHGVKRIDPVGDIFNPHHHQAIAQVENKTVAAGTILQVPQAGYMIEERVLRPAMVIVAQGGFKPVKEPKPEAGEIPDSTA